MTHIPGTFMNETTSTYAVKGGYSMHMHSEYLVIFLYVAVAIKLILAVIAGLSTGSFWAFVAGVLDCIPIVAVLGAFITLLRNQEDILEMIPTEAQKLETRIKQHLSGQNEKRAKTARRAMIGAMRSVRIADTGIWHARFPEVESRPRKSNDQSCCSCAGWRPGPITPGLVTRGDHRARPNGSRPNDARPPCQTLWCQTA